MTPRAFEDLLDLHGADPSRWPAPARAPAAALLATSDEARASLALMREAELFLRASHVAPDAQGFVAAHAMRHRQMRPARRAASRLGWASAAAAALAIGILVGGFFGPTHDDEASFALATALGPAETGYVD